MTTTTTNTNRCWAIVLAGGEGTRLRALTTRDGVATPKQFCSLRGGRSLLGDALARAARCAPRKQVVVVVAEEHRRFWERELAGFPAENIVVQPRNRGTAAGILLPALTVLERDPAAKLAILPSDHFVAREYVVAASLRLALSSLDELEHGMTLLGITPDAPETGYGWIVPANSDRLLAPVQRFVEKPDPATAAELFAHGALWNSFLFTVRGTSLLASFHARLPDLLAELTHAHAGDAANRQARLTALYERLESRDFSRDVLQQSASVLRLAIVPPCGWTDLGTPERVAACLAGLNPEPAPLVSSDSQAPFDLAHTLRGADAALSA